MNKYSLHKNWLVKIVDRPHLYLVLGYIRKFYNTYGAYEDIAPTEEQPFFIGMYNGSVYGLSFLESEDEEKFEVYNQIDFDKLPRTFVVYNDGSPEYGEYRKQYSEIFKNEVCDYEMAPEYLLGMSFVSSANRYEPYIIRHIYDSSSCPILSPSYFLDSQDSEVNKGELTTVQALIRTRHGLQFLNYIKSVRGSRNFSNGQYEDILNTQMLYNKDEDFGDLPPLDYKAERMLESKRVSTVLMNSVFSSDCNRNMIDYFTKCMFETTHDYFGLTEDNQISYMPYNKPMSNFSEWENNTGRQNMSPHKFFGMVFNDKYTEDEIKCFTDMLIALRNKSYEVIFAKGSDIANYYQTVQCQNWATTSCMQGKPAEYFRIYSSSPEKCRLGIILDEGEVVGRFLSWNTNEHGWVNDRLYYKDELLRVWYEKWCATEGHTRRKRNSYDNKDEFILPTGEEVSLELTVTLSENVSYMERLPYMDTFTFTDGDTDINNSGGSYEMDSTDGENLDGESENTVWDEYNDQYINEEEAVEIDFGRLAGTMTHQDSVMWSHANDGYILR